MLTIKHAPHQRTRWPTAHGTGQEGGAEEASARGHPAGFGLADDLTSQKAMYICIIKHCMDVDMQPKYREALQEAGSKKVRGQPPLAVRQSIRRFGQDLRLARLRRRLPVELVAARARIHRTTLARVEKGDPSVAIGTYAAVLFALGLGTPLSSLAESREDHAGLLLEEERLPRRIRRSKTKGVPHEP